MNIVFIHADVEAICRQSRLASKKLGPLSAQKLQRRLAELFNAETVSELVAGRPHPLTNDRRGQFAVDLHGGARLIFRPTLQPPPAKPDGSVDWSQITDITIVELGDYHD